MSTEKGVTNDSFEKSSEDEIKEEAISNGSKAPANNNLSQDVDPEGGNADGPAKRNIENPCSDLETLVHLLKGNVGSGSLAMPAAFLNSGLWVGLGGVPILGFICVHCMQLILECSRELCRRGKYISLSYEETAEVAFKLGPERIRSWHKGIGIAITTFLIITQLGFCCVYFVFVSQNMYQAVECIVGGSNYTEFDYMCLALIPIIIVCCIPDLKYLAPVSLVAGIIQTLGMLIIFYYLFRDLPYIETPVYGFAGWNSLPLYFGTALYAFEGIGLVLPLENKMKTPDSFPGLTGVLNTGMHIVICIYASLGFFGYLRYGDTVLGSITLNLPGDEPLSQSVKIMMSTAMLFTYPIQFYVPLQILKPFFTRRAQSKTGKIIIDYFLRLSMVLLTFILAGAIPNIGLFTNLIGSISSTALALLFPPLVHIVTFWPDMGKHNWKLYKNIAIIAFGVLGFITGALSSIRELILFFSEEQEGIELFC